MISCILLTAGLSQRFGSPKALAQFNGEILIERLLKMLLKTQVNEIIIVLGSQAEQIKPHLLKHKNIKVVYNKDYNFGQTSSFKVGLKSVSKGSDGVMLFPVDFPLIEGATINTLIDHFTNNAPSVLVPSYQGQKGHPPIFDISLRDEFLALDDQNGLNTVAYNHAEETLIVPLDDQGIIQSFNTQEELKLLQ